MKLIRNLIALSIFSATVVNAQLSPVQQALKASCPRYQFQTKEFSLSPLNPPAQVVSQVSLPAHRATLFRGTTEDNQQFTLESVAAGIFGQKNWYLGSPLFWGLTDVFKGQRNANLPFLPNGGLPYSLMQYASIRHIDSELKELLACKTNYSAAEANILAQDLLNKSFARMTSQYIQDNFFNMKNPRYYDSSLQDAGLGNNAIDFVISSYNDQVASVYGSKVLILKDVRNRALDLGFWNQVNTGQFWDNWVDNGEVNTPGYITADEVLGYQQRANDRVRGAISQGEPNNPIVYSLNKMVYKGQTFAVLLDGKRSLCIVESSTDKKFYFCEDNWSGRITRGIVAPPKERSNLMRDVVPLVGVFSTCTGAKCVNPKELIKWYGKISAKFATDAVDRIEKVSVDGAKITFTRAEGDDVPSLTKKTGPIEVLFATVANSTTGLKLDKGNVTDKAKAFAAGKMSMTYKISARFLGVPLTDSSQFELVWKCGERDIQRAHVAAPADGKTIDVTCEDSEND